jgi:hypothetical protein
VFIDGYSIKKASGVRRFIQTANNILRGDNAKKTSSWKRDVVIKKITEM